jgi:hypothetical protein
MAMALARSDACVVAEHAEKVAVAGVMAVLRREMR